ncbi:MAG: glycosyltransferase family 4 protein [Novosphingobium sp.]
MSPPIAPRIAYVINSVEGGGAASPVPAVTGILRDCGAAVRIFALTRRDGKSLAAMEAAGLEPLVRDGGETDHIAAMRWMVREIRTWGATHVWTSLSRATILGLLAGPHLGLPVIAWQHAAFLKPWNRRLMRLLQSRATLWVADSHCVAKLTAERLKVPARRLETWPIFAADPAKPVAQPWQSGQPLKIGSLGRLHPVKGYDVLIDALGLLKAQGFTPPAPLEISIAGDGAEREQLAARMAERGVSIALPGFTNDPAAYLASQHLYCQPSRSEGFCIGVHEALTAGLPVIASNVGEPALTIRSGETGWTCAPSNPAMLADVLHLALSDPNALAGMGRSARTEMLDRFSQARFRQRGTSIWSRIALKRDPTRS